MTEITPASAEGAATPAERPALPHHGAKGLVATFDVSVRIDTGKLAKVIAEDRSDVVGLFGDAHTVEHAMVAAFLNEVFEGSLVVLEAKPQTTINGGNAGFHILTVVTDGYGNLIAEGMKGEELAKVGVDPEATDLVKPAQELVGKVLETTD